MASSPLLTIVLILSAFLTILTPSCFADRYVLFSGQSLYRGQSLSYEDYELRMQDDCNLVLYDVNSLHLPLWASGTNRALDENCLLSLNSDGNLVVYDGHYRPIWASNTARGEGHYVLVLQPDRNVVIYGGSLWATGTNRVGTAAVVISGNSTKPAVVAGEGIAMVTGK